MNQKSPYGATVRFVGMFSVLVVLTGLLMWWSARTSGAFMSGLLEVVLFFAFLPIHTLIAYKFAKGRLVKSNPTVASKGVSADRSALHLLRLAIVILASWFVAWRLWFNYASEERPPLLVIAPVVIILQVFMLLLTPLISDIPDTSRRRAWFFIEVCAFFAIAIGGVVLPTFF